VVRERRLDDLRLHLAVERDRDLAVALLLADVDQRILLRQLRERDAEAGGVDRAARHGDRFERRRWELVMQRRRGCIPDPVADPALTEAPDPGDLAGGDCLPLDGRAALEDADRGDLLFGAAAEMQTVTRVHR